jgi:hypothetical protein
MGGDQTMITTGAKPKLSGFRCRELEKSCYKALQQLRELTGATTEEALQALIQLGADHWQQPTGRPQLVELIQGWKRQRPQGETPRAHAITAD